MAEHTMTFTDDELSLIFWSIEARVDQLNDTFNYPTIDKEKRKKQLKLRDDLINLLADIAFCMYPDENRKENEHG